MKELDKYVLCVGVSSGKPYRVRIDVSFVSFVIRHWSSTQGGLASLSLSGSFVSLGILVMQISIYTVMLYAQIYRRSFLSSCGSPLRDRAAITLLAHAKFNISL